MNNRLLTKRNIILFIIIAVLVVAIPVTIKLVQTQQQLKSKAAGTLTGSFTPLESGEYKVVVNAYDGKGGACSGNPFGLPSGWSDCGTDDNLTVTATTPGPRPALCSSTRADKTTLNSGDSITITSIANQAVSKFMYAFYNNDNSDPTSGPKGIAYDGNQQFAPIDPVSPATQTHAKLFSYADLAKPDNNWGGKVPTHIQVNGYFFDSSNNQSLSDVNCVVNFTLTTALPDLVTTQVGVLDKNQTHGTIAVGETSFPEGSIKNQGTGQAAASTYSYKIDNQSIGEQSAALLAPGYGTGLSHNVTWTATTAGTHTFTMCADSNNVVAESDESNNCTSVQFTVASSPAPPPPPPPANSISGVAYWFASGGWWVPDSGINITVYNGSTPVATAVSGANGLYTVINVPAGTYTVTGQKTIQTAPYSDSKNNISVTDGVATPNVNLFLLP